VIRSIENGFVGDFTRTGEASLCLSVTARVTLKNGTYHEDVGCGRIENYTSEAVSFASDERGDRRDIFAIFSGVELAHCPITLLSIPEPR
jgi:DNA repair and recombination protein RAD52